VTIPVSISTELQALQVQVAAALPLEEAPFSTIKAIQLNAINLTADIQSALVASSTLDTWIAPVDAMSLISGYLGVVSAADDQQALSLMRGIVGRATSNLDQLV